jgi:hypothetical protein
LVKALLTGLAMQQSLDPASVSDQMAVAGLAALVGLPDTQRGPKGAHASMSAVTSEYT